MEEGKEIQEQQPLVPGIGVAGQVSCPLSFMAVKQCCKQACEWWVELEYGKQKVARCAIPWLAVLSTEMRQAIDKLKKESDTEEKNGEESRK